MDIYRYIKKSFVTLNIQRFSLTNSHLAFICFDAEHERTPGSRSSKLSSADLSARSSGKRTKVGQSKINMHLFSKEETGEKLSRTSGNKR